MDEADPLGADAGATEMIRRRYQCPECSYEFNYDHHPSIEADPCPRYCARCGFDTEGEYDPALVMPHLGRPIKQIVDGQHRQMEEGAQFRADIAREQFGLDAEAANELKMTNMKDGLREGDTSDMPVNNDITRIMEAPQAQGMFGFQGAAGLGYSGSVGPGATDASGHLLPYPNAGARAMQVVRSEHRKTVASMGLPSADVVSDRPARETQHPGYRRRI